jgi:hypothetical protein
MTAFDKQALLIIIKSRKFKTLQTILTYSRCWKMNASDIAKAIKAGNGQQL